MMYGTNMKMIDILLQCNDISQANSTERNRLKILSLLKRFVPDVNWAVRIGKDNLCFSNMDSFKEPELPFLKFHVCPLFCTAFVGTFVTLRDSLIVPIK